MPKRRITTLLLLFTSLLLACQTLSPTRFLPVETTPVMKPVTVAEPTATITPFPHPPTKPPETDYRVRVHPDGELYVGDLVSFEVIAPEHANVADKQVEIQINPPGGAKLGPVDFRPFGLSNRLQATFWWLWDTSELEPGPVNVTFRILPDGESWTRTFDLLPEEALPANEAGAKWATAESECCVLHYITGTAVARDLDTLLETADELAADASQKMRLELDKRLHVVLVPRVFGQGGFASSEVYVSYLDRNYAGDILPAVLHHELIHVLDYRTEADYRPIMLVEGLAVYQTGGHFKLEALMARAAALLELDRYIPIVSLSNDFYNEQHEIGYMEAGALVQFMIETWGWEAYMDFYHDIQPHSSGTNAGAIDYALRAHFEISFSELEERFLLALRAQDPTPEMLADVQQSVMYFDTLRRYQQNLDSSAYFQTAWWPDVDEVADRGIVADFLRKPQRPENIALETMLITADAYLRAGNYAQSEAVLLAANAVLDLLEAGHLDPFDADPLAASYYAVVNTLLENGYNPQQIDLNSDSAEVLAYDPQAELVKVNLKLDDERWNLQ